MSENTVRMILNLYYEDDVVHPTDLAEKVRGWIDSALDDREDLINWSISYEAGKTPAPAVRPLAVGDVIHGFAEGIFGRDHYRCTRVEQLGPDWAVCRNSLGAVEMIKGREDLQDALEARDQPCGGLFGDGPCALEDK